MFTMRVLGLLMHRGDTFTVGFLSYTFLYVFYFVEKWTPFHDILLNVFGIADPTSKSGVPIHGGVRCWHANIFHMFIFMYLNFDLYV